MPSSRREFSSTLWNILKILLALALLVYVVTRTDLKEVRAVLGGLSPVWLAVSLVLFVLITLLKSLQYHALIGGGLTYPQVLNAVVVQNAVTNYLATGAGVVSLLASLRVEHGVRVSRTLAVFTLTKIGDLTAIWLGLLIYSVLVWDRIGILRGPVLLLLGGIGSAIGLVALVILYRQGFVSILERLLERLRLSGVPVIQKGLAILQAMAEMEQSRMAGRLGTIFVYSTVYLAFNLVWAYTNFMVFHVQMDFRLIALVSILTQLVSFIPVQVFGGLGVSEASTLYLFEILGVPQAVLASPLIGMRLLFYFANLIPLIYLPVHGALFRTGHPDPHEPR